MCELYIFVIFAFSCEFNRKNNLHSHFNVNSKEEQSTILLSCELKGFWVCELRVIIFVQTKFFNGCQVALYLDFCVILEGEQGLRKNI